VADGFHPGLPLRTERLILRAWRPDDAGDRAAYCGIVSDPDVVRYLYIEVLDDAGSDARLADRGTGLTAPGDWMNLAVEVAGSGEVAGDVGLGWLSAEDRQAEIGYMFRTAHQGRGFATEAAAAMVDLAFTGLGAHRVRGSLDARNAASARVLQRLGMRHEAHFVENEWVKGEWTDEAVYAVLDTEWAGRRA